MTRIDAMLEVYPSLTPEEARAKILEIDAEPPMPGEAKPQAAPQITDPSSGAPMRTPNGIANP